VDAVVIGAGPAGLATSRELTRAGVEHVVLERGDRAGHTWANLYDSLVLHTGRHLSSLPGMRFPRGTSLFPTRLEFVDYLDRYACGLPVRTSSRVEEARRSEDGWLLRISDGRVMRARTLVVATGIVSNPLSADIPGRTRFTRRIMHSVEYRRPHPFAGQRVLVVGAGNSAGEISAELAAAGVDVTVAVRSGARVVPRQLLGIPIQYVAVLLAGLPRHFQREISAAVARVSALARGTAVLPAARDRLCSDIPLIGFHLVDAIRAGRIRLRGAIQEFTGTGVRFMDGKEEPFDAVILATGYRAALDLLGGAIARDECGFARRDGRVASADQLDLYFVGHNYDTRGALLNISRDARTTAALIARKGISDRRRAGPDCHGK
jgi:cation diffusion facilitator CzcD-associated flavoprotein CzcO